LCAGGAGLAVGLARALRASSNTSNHAWAGPGIASATAGQVICHLVKANPEMPPEDGTGWHRHECDFQIVIMTKGWARFMYEDKPTLVQAGDVVHQRPGIVHYLYDYSPDMEYLEVVGPADFTTVDAVGPCPVPDPTPWK